MQTETIRPNGTARAAWFIWWAWFLSLTCFLAILHSLMVSDIRWLAFSAAAVFGLVMLVDRKRQHDRLSVTRRIVSGDENPDPPIQQVIQTNTGGGGRIQYGAFTLTRSKWAALGAAIHAHGDKLTRDIIPAGTFTNLNRRWGYIKAEFVRLGTIGEDQVLTQAGREWFAGFSPSLFGPVVHRNGNGGTTPPTTDDDDQIVRYLMDKRRRAHLLQGVRDDR